MEKATWLFKSSDMHTLLMFDTVKAKFNSMPIFLAKGAMELWFSYMSSKKVRSTLAT